LHGNEFCCEGNEGFEIPGRNEYAFLELSLILLLYNQHIMLLRALEHGG